LVTPSLLRIGDADGYPPLFLALKHHNDPRVIKLLISRNPETLVSLIGVEYVMSFFHHLPAENRFSNHAEISTLPRDCYMTHKLHRFPDLIKLGGTSDALEALVAAYDEDGLSLDVLCHRHSWDKMLARI